MFFEPILPTTVDIQAAAAPTSQPIQKMLYDRKSAAFALSISTRSLDYLIANKQLATRKLGKKIMVSASELARFSRMDHLQLTQTPAGRAH
jgi:hypothetical protein